jgi:prolyl-tRNA editing enzyme YbaK/EbsC (Cys-tRNA(Pro) deacylase)
VSGLHFRPVLDHLDLLARPVAEALTAWPGSEHVEVAEIDPAVSDTAAFVEATGISLSDSANCVVVGGRRGELERVAACLLLATTRANVNSVVRKRLDARRASFLSMDTAVERTGMEYGGITPIGLPEDWPVLVDSAVLERESIVVGAGVRGAKLRLPGALAAELPGAEVVEGLAT